MGRPTNRAERRADIVDGLLTVIAAHGYERASVARIARAAGLSPGLVHHHFGGKEEVLVALVETLAARVEARVPAHGSPREQLSGLVDAWLAPGPGSDPRAVAAWVAIGAEAVFLPPVREVFAAALRRTHTRLRWLAAASGASPDRAEAIAALVVASIQGAFLVASTAPALAPAGWAAPTVRASVEALLPQADGPDGDSTITAS